MVGEHLVRCSSDVFRQIDAPKGYPICEIDLVALLYSGLAVESKHRLCLCDFRVTAKRSKDGWHLQWKVFCTHRRVVADFGGKCDHRPCSR